MNVFKLPHGFYVRTIRFVSCLIFLSGVFGVYGSYRELSYAYLFSSFPEPVWENVLTVCVMVLSAAAFSRIAVKLDSNSAENSVQKFWVAHIVCYIISIAFLLTCIRDIAGFHVIFWITEAIILSGHSVTVYIITRKYR